MPEENKFKKRNAQIAERLRTPAAPRIKEADLRRRHMYTEGFNKRSAARGIAFQMEQSVRAVHYYLQLYDANPAKYDAVPVAPLTWKKWPQDMGM